MNPDSVIEGSLGLYLAYRTVRGVAYLVGGRPVYNMLEREVRHQRRLWRLLQKQDTPLGKCALKIEAHRIAFSLNVQMATPAAVHFVWGKAGKAGKSAFFWSIDLAPHLVGRMMPKQAAGFQQKMEKRRLRKYQQCILRRQARRARRDTALLVVRRSGLQRA